MEKNLKQIAIRGLRFVSIVDIYRFSKYCVGAAFGLFKYRDIDVDID